METPHTLIAGWCRQSVLLTCQMIAAFEQPDRSGGPCKLSAHDPVEFKVWKPGSLNFKITLKCFYNDHSCGLRVLTVDCVVAPWVLGLSNTTEKKSAISNCEGALHSMNFSAECKFTAPFLGNTTLWSCQLQGFAIVRFQMNFRPEITPELLATKKIFRKTNPKNESWPCTARLAGASWRISGRTLPSKESEII